MRPTVASSARRQQRIVVAPVAPAPDDPRPKALSNIKKSPRRRDQSESRAALLSLKNSFAASSSSSSADSKKNKKKNRKVAVQTENVGKKTSDEGRNPEEQIQQISVMPDQISKALPELFENLSPVSVLDVLYKDDDDSVSSRSSADQVARVELDKTFASSTTAVGLNSHRQAASGRLIKLRLFNAYCQDEEDCVEHWSKQQLECGRCKSQICQQIEAAIFDDLIYEAIIQLKAQRIKNSV